MGATTIRKVDTETAWAAGLFEGEGTVGFMRSSARPKRQSPIAAVNMADEDVVRRFAVWAAVGNVHGPYKRGEYKPTWRWSASSQRDVRLVMMRLMPYLMERRMERAALVADYCSDRLQLRRELPGHTRRLR